MILVTGASGFLGSHVLMQLVNDGQKVRALKRPSSDIGFVKSIFSYYHHENIFNSIEWADGDLGDIDSLQQAVDGVDQIYHCAATVTFSAKNRDFIFANNVKGTANLIDVAIKTHVKKFCHVSSIGALGTDILITEKTVWDKKNNHSIYGQSKHEAELQAWRGIAEGLETIIVNPSVIIGPWKLNTGIGKLFQQIISGLKYYTGGSNGFVDVRDVARAMVLLMHSGIKNDSFIISAENISFRNMLATIARLTGGKEPNRKASKTMTDIAWRLATLKSVFSRKKSDFNKDTARISQSISVYSNEKIVKALDFSFIPVAKSLEDYYTFYKDHT